MIQKILLATDGSNCSEKALYYAASLARNYHTGIVIVHAYLPAPETPAEHPNQPPIYETHEQASRLVELAAIRLREMGSPEVEGEAIPGPAVNVILGAVEDHRPDILIMGARGHSLWPGLQPGSVSSAVAQRAECTVLLVR